ncbi:zinc ABC transporter substrate-binding protein [Marinomonas sp. 2405UD68-3]|uniref:zinc ABC transporter substrate-binding protein n=1 Tax=Marinomonas sp. 2405UD68-3 TaxID=3391835 RepID=UPI0039C98443
MNKYSLLGSVGVGLCLGWSGMSYAQPIIATSIKPVTMIVEAIAGEHAKVQQIVSNSASPHDFALRPSDVRKIHQADTVVWVGESLETFMEKALINADKFDSSIEWLTVSNMTLRHYSDDHDEHHDDHDKHHDDHDKHHDEHHDDHDKHHDDHDKHHDDHDKHHDDHDKHHDDHDEHHDDHDKHHDDHDEHHDDHAGHQGHNHDGVDPHVWLDPDNAVALAKAVMQKLTGLDPENQTHYEHNLSVFIDSVNAAEASISASMEESRKLNYIVFHDAYGYFESHFDIHPVDSISVNPERKPGAKKVTEIQSLIKEKSVQCIFTEPQFNPRIVSSLIEGTQVKSAQLDPLGVDIDLGPSAYPDFLMSLNKQIQSCL